MVTNLRRSYLWVGVVLAVCAAVLVFWRLQPEKSPGDLSVGLVCVRNLDELEGVLRYGVSSQELLQVLGPPAGSFQFEGGVHEWFYSLGRKRMERPWDKAICGFNVRLTNGHVAAWDYIYRISHSRQYGIEVPATQGTDRQEAEDNNPPVLVFHVLTEGAFEGHDDVWQDTGENTWHKSCEAEFVAETLAKVEGFQGRDSTGRSVWGVTLRLRKEDVKRFNEFTARHVGRMIVITVGGQVAATPILTAPVRDGAVEVSHLRTEDVGGLLVKLKRLERPSR